MAEESNSLDLKLWLDQDIIPRQNRLKARFLEMLADVGNSLDLKKLSEIHDPSRGIKLSKGNDLVGFPYQVLDLIRDFDSDKGLNIRVLNWFGHGLFLFVLLGKNHPKSPFEKLGEHNWLFDKSPTPWDYPEILLNDASTKTPTESDLKKSSFCQWHKEIQSTEDLNDIQVEILDELKNLILLLS